MELPADWKLGEELTIEQIEVANLYEDDGRVPHVPFGFGNPDWLGFKAQVQPGNKLHLFESSPKSWRNLAGRAGYLLLRGNEVVDTFVTIMN